MSLDDLLKDLKVEYLQSLPDKITRMEVLFNHGDVPALREEFHKLKGTGSTYGFSEVSQVSQLAEEICVKHPDQALRTLPAAFAMLKKTTQCRKEGRKYVVDEDPDYVVLKKVLNLNK